MPQKIHFKALRVAKSALARSLEVLIEDHQKVMALNQSAWAQTRQLEEANNALKHDLLKIVGESSVRKQVKIMKIKAKSNFRFSSNLIE